MFDYASFYIKEIGYAVEGELFLLRWGGKNTILLIQISVVCKYSNMFDKQISFVWWEVDNWWD